MASIIETGNGVVYLLTSPSGKQYVGQTWDLRERMRKYKNGGDKRQRAIYNAIVKYGWDYFAIVVLASGIQDQPTLDKVEDAFIVMLNTLSPHGYNLRRGGNGGRLSDETRKKMRKPKSEQHRANISSARTGVKRKPFTDEWRNNLSVSHRRFFCANINRVIVMKESGMSLRKIAEVVGTTSSGTIHTWLVRAKKEFVIP